MTTTTASAATAAPARTLGLPSPWALGPGRIGFEVRGYFRQADSVFFTFLFPLMMLVIFSTIFTDDISPAAITGDPAAGTEQISMVTYYLPAMIAAGLLLSGVQNLAIDIAQEKYSGRLKRLGGTPMSPVTYFIGKLGQVFVTGIGQCALLLAFASLVLGADLPTDADAWGRFAWIFVLGLSTSALLGIALSAVPRSARSASAVVIPTVLLLQFISGVYVPAFELPDSLIRIADVFPLAHLARGMRSVFLPQEFAALEIGGTWALGTSALILAAWLIVGFVLTRLTFRWIRRDA